MTRRTHICTLITALVLGAQTVSACSLPSTYTPTPADTSLIQSVQPMMQRIFDQSPDRIIQIQNKIHTIAMQFDVSTREYYILREINLSMNSLISSMGEIPAYDGGHNLKPYMLYSPELIEMAKEHGLTIVLNFRASRCPRCKAASEDIIVNQQLIPREVIVIEADYDTTKDLQELYGVTQQTTFVFLDSSGNKIKNVEKLTGIDQLVEELGKI